MSRKAATEAGAWTEPTAVERALGSLDMAMPQVEPPAGLWARIEARLEASQPIRRLGPEVERYEGGTWRTLAPGVRMKRLWGKRTLLIECQPGAVVPAHRHRTFEHSLILSGDVTGDEGDYQAGDYQGMPAGSHHGAWSTRGGCRVLIQYDA
ncbi:MAG: cupin domain-containing protein [Caulobacterales bacterium]|jgi:anti-sigma factor ChrR (cupin superfamily)